MRELREQLLGIIEKNSRIDLKELAVILGVEEVDVVNELAAMEMCIRDRICTGWLHVPPDGPYDPY